MNEAAYHATLWRLGVEPVGAGACPCLACCDARGPAARHDEMSRRVETFRQQLDEWTRTGRAGVPLLALPGAEAGPGRCAGCGDPLDAGRSWRCPPCEAAVREVLGLPTAGSEA